MNHLSLNYIIIPNNILGVSKSISKKINFYCLDFSYNWLIDIFNLLKKSLIFKPVIIVI